jgi:iron complex transport system substrate-binding protein
MMKFLSGFAALAAAGECGPTVVKDGQFPPESRADYKTYTQVDYADHFDIIYASTFKVLNNVPAKEQYVLTMCGNDAPDNATIDKAAALPEGFTRKSFTVPLPSYGSDSTATLAFLDIIDVHDRQLYISQYANAPCLQKAMNCSSAMVAADPYGGDEAVALRKEQIAETAGFFVDGASELPNAIAVASHKDPHLLNRAEWIKFVAAFFNREDAAEKHMNDEAAAWDTLSTDAKAKAATPLVAFIEKDSWNKVYKIKLDHYKTRLVEAAGGKSFTSSELTTHSALAVVNALATGDIVSYDATNDDAVAAFRAKVNEADVLIDETSGWPDTAAYNAASFTGHFGFDAPAATFRTDGLLGGTQGNGMDWFEGAFARPAEVLADFVAAMHATGGDTTWLRKLDESATVVTHKHCEYEIPVCSATGTDATVTGAKEIESPCDRYKAACAVDDAVEDLKTAVESSSVGAALLIAAAAFA